MVGQDGSTQISPDLLYFCLFPEFSLFATFSTLTLRPVCHTLWTRNSLPIIPTCQQGMTSPWCSILLWLTRTTSTLVPGICQFYSSDFNTVSPSKLVLNLKQLGISTQLYNWILDFCPNRLPHLLQFLRGYCVLSAVLYSLFTRDCVPICASNSIINLNIKHQT